MGKNVGAGPKPVSHTDEEKVRQVDMSQHKSALTLIETYKEGESIISQANVYQLPESPDVQQYKDLTPIA